MSRIAQHLADLGLPLIELCGPDCSGGRHGHDERASGKAPLRAGWTRQAHRAVLPAHSGNWGIPLGAISGLVVVDTDTEEQEAWVAANLPATPRMVRTRSGWHRYYRHPGCTVRSAPRKDASGVKLADIKADGGQTVAPGSRHRSGHTYEWAAPWAATDTLPTYDEAWFPVPGSAHQRPQDASGAAARTAAAPGSVLASLSVREAVERYARAARYASMAPASRSGHGGEAALWAAALAIRLGFMPPAPWATICAASREGRTVDASRESANEATIEILTERFDPRCVDEDGATPFPWGAATIARKASEAAGAHLSGKPRRWLLLDEQRRSGWRRFWAHPDALHHLADYMAGERVPLLPEDPGDDPEPDPGPSDGSPKNDEPPTALTIEGSVMDQNNMKVAQTMPTVNNILSLGLASMPAPAQPPKPAIDEPIPLGEAGALPSFPAGILRGSVGGYAAAVAASTQTPPDMAYMAALAALSAAARGRFEVQVKADYAELASLYIAIAAASGERKSAMRSLYAPIRAMESEWMASAAKAAEQHAARLVALQHDLDAACGGGGKSKAARKPAKPESGTLEDAPPPTVEEPSDDEARRDEAAAALAAAKSEAPVSGRIIVEDATPEGLTRVMAGSGGAIALLTDEGGDVFQMMAGGYSDVARLNVYLKSYSGDTLIVDRAGTGHTVIQRPVLTMGILSQPDTLRKLAHRDISERGLSARFLFALPSSLVGARYGEPEAPAPELAQSYAATLKAIMNYRPDMPWLNVRLSDGARKVYASHRDDIERRLGRGGDLEATRAWGSKIVGQAVRIAALLHIADVVDGVAEAVVEVVDGKEKRRYPITADAMDRAVRLTNEYLIPHARAAFGLMGEGDAVAAARRALDALKRKGIREFGRRDLQRLVASRGKAEDVVDPAIEVLVSHGWIREIEGKRKDSRRFAVHPSAFAG